MGSVKNLIIEKEPTANALGVGYFEFTDDYSVFDYGKMPDTIPGKGESLCKVASFNFKQIAKLLNIKTHFIEQVAPNKMKISLVRVIRDYNALKGEKNFLIPLEIIFRNSLPEGSSVFKRLSRGEITPQDLGLADYPKPGTKLEKPIVDFSTKLEEVDRYLKPNEAKELAKLTDGEFEKMKEITLSIDAWLTERAESLGLSHEDGKLEFAFDNNRELMVVDVFGTMDENRFSYNGFALSKQILRDYYKTTPWYKELEEAKNNGLEKSKWPSPPRLPQKLIEIVSNLYKGFAELWTGEKIWGVKSLDETIEEYYRWKDEL
ncbi:MAG: phosphoribosylaminoimidazolesuccinocarboxamide synthase [Candidatus Iainarchaeum archaeon]|uniref:Phosphoribosylaminoimidazole-succinocarboxamide synthase n=1 Tax=Candidatus Iainarchaeum sp. TaxID=3101447 RepID=A0A497JIL6_9ARCH|nr:MAG: phosphoribosylaminoimidazolesuccinocarboxamide synthase [Candidatus Diapherotrites archaeon]